MKTKFDFSLLDIQQLCLVTLELNNSLQLTNSFTNENLEFINEFFVECFVLVRRDEAVETFALDGMWTGHDGSF